MALYYGSGVIFMIVMIKKNKKMSGIVLSFMATIAILILSGTGACAGQINELHDGSNLTYSELQGADLYRSHLIGADLTDADLTDFSAIFREPHECPHEGGIARWCESDCSALKLG
ncbi:MAG: pentapeptide repeat-containing protein [Methanothrix sp.]